MSAPRVSVVVVSYNTNDKLRRCLSCIETHHEVIVVDNASGDGSADMVALDFPHVTLIRSDRNLGFGPANNLGCTKAHGDAVLFLNSDAYAEPGAIDKLASVLDHPDVVAVGGRLLNPDGSLQGSTANELTLWSVFCEQTLLEKAFPSSRIFSPYWTTLRSGDREDPWQTPQLMGASLMVRAKDGRPMEEFDPRYFLYCEDTDLCKRLSVLGRLLYVPTARFTHDLGSSSGRDPAMGVIRYNRGKELYFRIHHGAFASAICLLLDRGGALLRLLGWTLIAAAKLGRDQRANGQVKSFWRVLTALRP